MSILKYLTGRAEIKKQLKFQNIVYIFFIIAAVIYYVLKLSGKLYIANIQSLTILDSISACVAIISIIRIIKNIRITKNENILRNYEISLKDERSIAIQRRALSTSFTISTWIGVIIATIIAVFNPIVAITIFYSICFLLITYVIFSYIFNKIM